jgi:hypothetical protein
MRKSPIVFDQDNRVDIVADIKFRPQLLSGGGLKWRETEPFRMIVADNEIDGTVTEITYAVE